MKFLSIARSVLAAGSIFVAVQASAVVLQVNGSGILTGATGVMVEGKAYDVTFKDGTCAQVYGSCTASAFDFKTATSAKAAAQALLDSVFTGIYDTDTKITFGCGNAFACYSIIAYDTDFPLFEASYAYNFSSLHGSTDEVDITVWDRPYNSANNSYANFAVFRAAATVPEPGSVALFGITLFGLVASRRRTK